MAGSSNRESEQAERGNTEAEAPLERLIELLGDLQITSSASATAKSASEPEADQILDKLQQLIIPNTAPAPKAESKPSDRTREQSDRQSAQVQPQEIQSSATTPQTTETTANNVLAPFEVSFSQRLAHLEKKLTKLEQQVHSPTEILDPLVPLIVELLELKAGGLRTSIVEAVVPVLDEIIERRAKEAPQKMGAAIASMIPRAISYEIEVSPREVAQALAPEIALAIEAQIQLDREAIAKALGSEMGRAIKVQIEQERDAMVDALYPVIGSTISKYMVEVVNSINQKVETALSPEGIKRKIRAKLQGVSEAELILQETVQYHVQAVLLIQKASGLVIWQTQPLAQPQLEASLLAGMLTAIRSFVNEYIAQQEVSELSEINYGDAKILLEVAGYCYLAVLIKGEPARQFIQKIRHTLSTIVIKYGKAIEQFDGDPATLPQGLQPLLETLLDKEQKNKNAAKFPTVLVVLLLAALSVVFIPFGIIQYRGQVAKRLEAQATAALDATPELSVYRIVPNVRQGQLTLTGRVPSQSLRDRAGQVASTIASHLKLNNQIVAVEVPPVPEAIAAEIERVTGVFNQSEGVTLTTRYQNSTVTLEGNVPNQVMLQQIVKGIEQIPSVRTVIATVQVGLPTLKTRIYFEVNTAQPKSNISDKISEITQFLSQNPKLQLEIIGHSDPAGQSSSNQALAVKRARAVEQRLIAQGIAPERLQVTSGAQLPPDVTDRDPPWLSRCVRFEPFTSPPQTE